MSENIQIFENEEASQFLNYFVAYRKLQSKIEQVKCIAALNRDANLCLKQPEPQCSAVDLEPALPLNLQK